MADSKISALTSYTTPLVADLIPIVDTANATTKQITWANFFKSPTLITPTLGVATATSINGLTITSSTGTFSLTNAKTFSVLKTMSFTAVDDTGVYTLPTGTKTLVATDVTTLSSLALPESQLTFTDITTNNVSTSKHGFAPKAPNDATKYLDGTGNYSVPTASATPTMILSTDFTAQARFVKSGSGTATYGSNGNPIGVNIETTSGSGNYLQLFWGIFPDNTGKAFLVGGTFSCSLNWNQPFATTGQAYVGLGVPTAAGSGFTFTDNHIGFKFITAAGTTSLYATVANGTEAASSALTTFTGTTSFDLMFVVNSANLVTFYYRKDGDASYSTTTLTTNIPTANEMYATFAISNANTANNGQFQISGATYQR